MSKRLRRLESKPPHICPSRQLILIPINVEIGINSLCSQPSGYWCSVDIQVRLTEMISSRHLATSLAKAFSISTFKSRMSRMHDFRNSQELPLTSRACTTLVFPITESTCSGKLTLFLQVNNNSNTFSVRTPCCVGECAREMDKWLGVVVQAGLEDNVDEYDVPLLLNISSALVLNDIGEFYGVTIRQVFIITRMCTMRCWILGRGCSGRGSVSRRNSLLSSISK